MRMLLETSGAEDACNLSPAHEHAIGQWQRMTSRYDARKYGNGHGLKQKRTIHSVRRSARKGTITQRITTYLL